MGFMNTGPLKTLRDALYGNDKYLVAFHGIHMKILAKWAFSNLTLGCGANNDNF